MDLSVLEGNDPAGYQAEEKLNRRKHRLENENGGRKRAPKVNPGMVNTEGTALLNMYYKRRNREVDKSELINDQEREAKAKEAAKEKAKRDIIQGMSEKTAKRREKRLKKKMKKLEPKDSQGKSSYNNESSDSD